MCERVRERESVRESEREIEDWMKVSKTGKDSKETNKSKTILNRENNNMRH